ncbi:hypothetical protein UlMin_039123 [Ulmus minor]
MHWCTWERLCVHKLNGGIGFRDMRLFNKAILAKQAWRILTCPSSLAARVLQGFYFTNSTFLQVRKTSFASFVWRSILWGRELLMQGSRRKIGSGNDTYIYHDRWLPRDGSFRISSPRVLAILSLPTPNRPTADSLTWHYNKRGHYTVRSGYWVAKGGMETISSSSSSNHIPWWKQFWRLQIPAKIRIFVWKAYNDWIPTAVNLANHGVPTHKRCSICSEANDTTTHGLWECTAMKPLKPPEMGIVKINTDAAWCNRTKKFGLGVVIRDHSGSILGSAATPVSSFVSVDVAEGWALERGVRLAKYLGFSAIELESDCLGVVMAL